jgi:hypothetical protein
MGILVTPVLLRSQLSAYDGGLALTLARFLEPGRLPYRDLWTLYGPGPPILGSMIMSLFGPGLGPQRVFQVLVHAGIVAATYLVARRYVPGWVAAALAAMTAAVAAPIHFQQTIALLLWGLWFLLRAGDDPARAPRRLNVAALLFGLSFWGRFEFVLVGPALVIGLAIWLRGRIDDRHRRRILWIGLTPPALFLAYLLGVVGPERAWLNLVEYPFLRYPDGACRGLPGSWGAALRALAAPLRGSAWTANELVLWTATFLPPVLGAVCLAAAAGDRRARSLRMYAAGAVGAISILLWLEHRPRASASPDALVPLIALSAAVALGALARRNRIAARWASAATVSVVALTLVTSSVPASVRAWTDWPSYHPKLAWEGQRVEGLYDEEVWSRVASVVRARTQPEEEIFVALTDNRRHHANAPIFYWFADRPPASRFVEFNPCLTDTAEVQRAIVADLAGVDMVIATTFFVDTRPSSGTGPSVLDEYLRSRFQPVYRGELPQDQAVIVLERRQAPR